MFDIFHDVFVFMKKHNNKAKVKDDICTTEIVKGGKLNRLIRLTSNQAKHLIIF
jgi:hypothetical protein